MSPSASSDGILDPRSSRTPPRSESFCDPPSGRFLSELDLKPSASGPRDQDGVPELYDSAMLSQSKSSDILASSAEPASIHPAASTHIDVNGLEYDFSNTNTRIGVGTYGSVFLGNYFGEHVAIKRIRIPSANPGVAEDPFVAKRHADAISQFAREIRRYERVNHPGIVRFYGVTLDSGPSALLVTEFMPGGSLAEAMRELRKDGLSFHLQSVIRIAMQACSGLRALHGHGCTWGDAKPENILLSEPLENGVFPPMAEARIADFGLSRSVGQTLLGETTLAGTGQPAGTCTYMAPETFLVADRESTERAKASDIYSLGMVIYEMLTLRTPWKRRPVNSVLIAIRNGERPKWPTQGDSDFRQPVPKDLQDVVEKCWEHDPENRPTAEAVFAALDRFSLSVDDRDSQRPIMDLSMAGSASNADGRLFSGGAYTHVFSKQSTMSTAIAIPDGSVDIGSQALDSTTESKKILDIPGDDIIGDSDLAETAPVRNPTVSPVTSPEPRSNNRHSGSDVPKLDDRRPAVNSSTASLGTESQTAAVQQMAVAKGYFQDKVIQPMANKADRDSLLESREGWGSGQSDLKYHAALSHEMASLDTSITGAGQGKMNFANIPSEEFVKHCDEVAIATGKAAARIMAREDIDEHNGGSPDWSHPGHIGALTGSNAICASNGESDLFSSSNSVASARRKRTKRLQTIIEQAAVAFIEIRRRENKLPPKQRKEAAEKRAEEDARISLEKEAVKVVDEASKVDDFSVALKQVKAHRSSQAVVKAGMMILERCCRKESIFFDLCEEGGVEELVSGASLHGANDEAIAISFCNSILALSEHCNDTVGHMIRAVGAPSQVIELLEYHKTKAEVQRVGCDCLAVIAGSSELSRSAVATLGGPAAVYKAMSKNNLSFKNPGLAKSALKAIRYIAQDNEKAAEYLVQVAALDTVSKAAEVFTDHGLEGDILSALRAFTFYDGGRRNVIMSSGLKALTAVMVRNKEPEFLVHCCTFIRAIARWRDHECEAAMLESCITARITELMQMSNDVPGDDGAKVAWYSSHACTFLASFGSRSRQRLRDVGAIETAIFILRARKENARVVHSATDAIAELLKGEPVSMRVAEEAGVVAALNEALVLHRNVVRVRKALEWTLNMLRSPPPYESRVYQELMNSNRQQPGQVLVDDGGKSSRRPWHLFGRRR